MLGSKQQRNAARHGPRATPGAGIAGARLITGRIPTRLAWSLWLLTLTLAVAGEGLNLFLGQAALSDRILQTVVVFLPIPYAYIGALITTRRPRNRIGPLLLGGAIAFCGFTTAAIVLGLDRSDLPGLRVIGWVGNWIGAPAAVALMLLLLLYPSGRLPSHRWQPVAWAVMAWGGAALVVLAVSPRLFLDQAGTLSNPIGLRGGLADGLRRLLAIKALLAVPLVLLFAAASSLIGRFHRARGVERQQLKWLAYVAAIGAALVLVPTVGAAMAPGWVDPDSPLVIAGSLMVPLWMIPVALGVAILRYRLYDIDRIINRTLVYGLLTALLAGVYAGLVLALGQAFGRLGVEPPNWAVAGATLAVAALFQPARRRIQQVVDRHFNRRRYDAAKTIDAFNARLREQLDLDTLSAELLGVVDQTMQPTKVSLWLRPAARAPQDHGESVAHRPIHR